MDQRVCKTYRIIINRLGTIIFHFRSKCFENLAVRMSLEFCSIRGEIMSLPTILERQCEQPRSF